MYESASQFTAYLFTKEHNKCNQQIIEKRIDVLGKTLYFVHAKNNHLV